MGITGKNLIEMGYKPGKWFKQALEHINKEKLEGSTLRDYLDNQCPAPPLSPHQQPLPYYKNIEAQTPYEQENLDKVCANMDILMKTPVLKTGAIMPDACPTSELGGIPVGGVVVSEHIHPSMHSADICCSVMMTNYGKIDPKTLLDKAHSIVHFGRTPRPQKFSLPKDLKKEIKKHVYLKDIQSFAKSHMGSAGDGNHFLFVGQSENSGDTIVVTHYGSRRFGALLYKQGKKIAEKFRKKISPKTFSYNAWIPSDSPEGEDYWEALQIIREWTKLNHSIIHDEIARRLHVDPLLQFWNEHNFVFKHNNLFYHAKGATPLDDKFVPDSYNGLRLIPLNMSEPILVVKGETTTENLGFAPHGAGRNKSRTQHRKDMGHMTDQEILEKEVGHLDIRFFGGKPDITELPSAYKDAASIQEQMKKFRLGSVVDRILPYGSIMAGN